VNSGNEIAFNTIRNTGMEKCAAPALVLDQSTNSHTHHNHISETRFTAIALTAPRQLMFAAQHEGTKTQAVGNAVIDEAAR
jgi:hypothetical protein